MKNMSRKWRIVSVIFVLLVCVGTLTLVYWPSTREYSNTQNTSSTTTTANNKDRGVGVVAQNAWQTYADSVYNFSITYPDTWRVAKDEYVGYPRITFYDPAEAHGLKPPFDHHTLVTHVSVFPKGIPTEGVSGEMVDTQVQSQEQLVHGTDFLLKDKTPWATMFTFKNMPTSWDGGFVWAGVFIQNLDTTCVRGTQFVPYEQCDVLTGDTYIRKGIVDAGTRAVEVTMLESFHFTTQNTR